MKVALLGLPLVGLRGDPFGSIPAMPTALPVLAAWLKKGGHAVQVIDGFGSDPQRRFSPADGLIGRGLDPSELAGRVDKDVDLVGMSVHSVAVDTVALETLRRLRARGFPVAVGGAHPSLLPHRFLEGGATWVLAGEGERGLERVLSEAAPERTVIECEPIEDLDTLPIPELGLLPLTTYWTLGLGHGPVRGPFLNISTSRGCSQGCRFCATPSFMPRRWRGQSAARCLEDLTWLASHYNVRDFHLEDDDFASDPHRVAELCEGILSQELDLTFCLPSGIRAGTLDVSTVELLARAGCRYISLAPESGSERVLRSMGKNVDLGHLVSIARAASSNGIRVGCFLILGYPRERARDRAATAALLDTLIAAGVDDLSIFIWSPLPGAHSFGEERGFSSYEQLCWTPRWRAGYARFEGARVALYLRAIMGLARLRPWDVAKRLRSIRAKQFETKGEMTLARMLG